MEGNNMVVEQPKKKSNALLVILMLLIGIGIGFGANYGMSYFNKDVDKKDGSVTEDTTKTDKLELTESDKAKLEMIVGSAAICSSGGANCDTAKKYFDSIDKLDNKMKYTIVWNYVLRYLRADGFNTYTEPADVGKMETSFTSEQLKNYTTDDFYSISKSGFDNTYKLFFNETPSYSIKDLEDLGCPSPGAIDSNTNRIIFIHACGGTGYGIGTTIKSFDSDENNYLVHAEIEESSIEDGNKTYKILWKFDKDLNFVSTEKE